MSPQDDDFDESYEDEIACTYDTHEEFEAAMQAWIQKGG